MEIDAVVSVLEWLNGDQVFSVLFVLWNSHSMDPDLPPQPTFFAAKRTRPQTDEVQEQVPSIHFAYSSLFTQSLM